MLNKVIVLAGLFLLSVRPLFAAEKKGISITPPFEEVVIGTEKQKEIDLIITNNTDSEEVFDLSVVDFGSLDETGGVAFLTTKADSAEKKYSLASWISLEKNEVIIKPGLSQKIKVTILNKESLSPGGHYGAVLATIKTNDVRQMDSVGVNQSLASLLYVLKNGGETYKLGLKDFFKVNDLWGMPKTASIRLINEGNTHSVPRGALEIFYGNNLIAKGIVNETSGKILPETIRVFEFNINKMNKWNWPGKYQIKLSLRSSDREVFTVKNDYFYYWGYEGFVILIFSMGFLGILGISIGKKIKS